MALRVLVNALQKCSLEIENAWHAWLHAYNVRNSLFVHLVLHLFSCTYQTVWPIAHRTVSLYKIQSVDVCSVIQAAKHVLWIQTTAYHVTEMQFFITEPVSINVQPTPTKMGENVWLVLGPVDNATMLLTVLTVLKAFYLRKNNVFLIVLSINFQLLGDVFIVLMVAKVVLTRQLIVQFVSQGFTNILTTVVATHVQC
jgi:hypothetical protein